MTKRNRKTSDRGDAMKLKILRKGIDMWLQNPSSVTAHGIAIQLGIVHGTVLYHFPYGVREAVAEYALAAGNKRIISQLIVEGHQLVENLTPTERASYLSGI